MKPRKTHNTKKVTELVYHRNGISGLGFYVAKVDEWENGEYRPMLVIRFPKEADNKVGAVLCAAFDLNKLDNRDIAFGSNSWRGDHYAECMDHAIADQEKN